MDNACGIGCRIDTLSDGKLCVAEVHSWGGAAQSGNVFVRDVLHTVNGARVTSSEDAKNVILGKPGTSVVLGISRAGVHHDVTVVRTACPRSTAAAQPLLVTEENPDSPTPGLNDPHAIDVASSSSHEPPPLSKDPSPSAAPPSQQVVAPPQNLGGLDMNEKLRIVAMIADIDSKHQSKIFGIIEKHQPTLLCASSEIDIHVESLDDSTLMDLRDLCERSSHESDIQRQRLLDSVTSCKYCGAASSEFVLDDSCSQLTCTRCGSQLGGMGQKDWMDLSITGATASLSECPRDRPALAGLLNEGGGAARAHGACEATAENTPKDKIAIGLKPSALPAGASAECEVECEPSIPEGSDAVSLVPEGSDAVSLVQWYSLESSDAEPPRTAASVFSGSIQPSPPIYHVLKQVHPDAEIKSRAMKRLQKMITWFTFQTLKSLDHASRMQDLHDHSGSHQVVSEVLSALQEALAGVLVGELHKHAMNEAIKATQKCVTYAAGSWTQIDELRGPLGRIAGLQFDCAAVEKGSRAMGLPLSIYMAVPFAAVLEYLSAELLELSGNKCRDRQSEAINVADIEKCVKDDEELSKTFEAFSSRYVISILDSNASDSKTIQSKAVAQYAFSATQSTSPEGSCVSFLETFLIEAACACASNKLSSIKVKQLTKELTLLCSGEAFQSLPRSSHCILMITALELVSLYGSEAVVPFAADHHLTQLRLRLSSCVHTVCDISDTRSVALYLLHTAKMMCGWSIGRFQKYQGCFIPRLCRLLSLYGRFDPEELLDCVFAEITDGTASFGSNFGDAVGDAVQSVPALEADSISKLCRMAIDISALFASRSNETKQANLMEVPNPQITKPNNWAKLLHKSSALQALATAFPLQLTFHEFSVISVPSHVFDAFAPQRACKTTQVYMENSKLFDKLLSEQKQLQSALTALNSTFCGEAASALIHTEIERKEDILRKWSELRSLMTGAPHSAEAISGLQRVCDDHNLSLLHYSFSPYLGAGCVTLQDGVRLSVTSALVLYMLETLDSAPMCTVQIAQHLNMPQELVVESMAILAKHGYVADGRLVSPLGQDCRDFGSERCCAPCIEPSSCAPCDCLSNPKDFVMICSSILQVLLQNASVPEVSLYGMLTQHQPSQVSHALAQLRAKDVICLKNGNVAFPTNKSPDSDQNDLVPRVNLVLDSEFLHFSGTRFKGSRWLFFDRTLGASAIQTPGLDFAASSVLEASSSSRTFSSDDIQAYLTSVIQAIESCVTSHSVAFAEILSDFVKCGGCAAKTLLLHLQKHSTTPMAMPEEVGDAVCSICLEEPCALWFPCCSNQLCEMCFKIHYFAQHTTTRTDSTPTVSALVQAASLHSDKLGDSATPIAFKCPFPTCKGVLPRKYFQTLLRNMRFFSNEMATALSKAAVSLCSSMRPSSAYAVCSAPLPDGAVCNKFHVGVTAAASIQCDCGVHSTVSVMKHVTQDFQAFPYLNLTASQVVDWFSESIKSKFNASLSERIQLDGTSLSSGRYKMCPRCKHGPIEHTNCSHLSTHFGESKGSWMIDNRCEVCRFFSTESSDWPLYDEKASCAAQGYLGQLHKDVTDSVAVIENFLQDLSWYFVADNWSWTLDLARHVSNLLTARSSLILFFVDSLSSYNPDSHRGDKSHSRDTLNADWSPNDCRAQLLMQSMKIRYKTTGPDQFLHGYKLVFRICSIVQSTVKALTPKQMDAAKQIVTQSSRYKGLHSMTHIRTFLEPVDQLISSQSNAASFLARHTSCFSTKVAFETAYILLSSGCFVIEISGDDMFKLHVSKSCPLHEVVVGLKDCGTGIVPLHILTLLAHFLQPHTALEIMSRSTEDVHVEINTIARRLVKQYCHSGGVASSELMGGRKLMESMAAASQLDMTPSKKLMESMSNSELLDGDQASESNSDVSNDSDYEDPDENES